MTFVEFSRMAMRNPFRRVIVEAGDSLVAISQPVCNTTTTADGFMTRKDLCWKWLKYLGHQGD